MKEEEKSRAQILGENLERIRKEKGYTRKQLADVIGVKETSYGKYERGEVLAPLDKIFELAIFFGLSILDLTGDNPDVEDNKSIEYRYKKAILKLDDLKYFFDLKNEGTDNEYIIVYIPRRTEYTDGVLTEFGSIDAIAFKNKIDFIQVIEQAETQALYQSFNEALRSIVFK